MILNQRHRNVALLMSSLSVLTPVFSKEMNELEDLDLGELFNLTVESASRSEMKIQKSPGVIRVFTSNDFEMYSMNSLGDVLQFVPGIQNITGSSGSDVAWIRGIQTRYNSKVLFLIDGVPVRDGYYGHFDIDKVVSMNNVEKIEIINGPGSVLYGPNAFAGVVSVTTKFGKDANETGITYKGGINSNDQNSSWYNQGGLYSGFGNKYFRAYGEMAKGTVYQPELNSVAESYAHDNNMDRLAAYTGFKTKYLEGSFNYSRTTTPDGYQDAYEDEITRTEPIFGSLRFSYDFSEKFSVSVLPYVSTYRRIDMGYKYLDEYDNEDGETVTIEPDNHLIVEEDTSFINTMLAGADLEITKRFGDNNELKFGILGQYDRSFDKISKSTREYMDDGAPNMSGLEKSSKLESEAKRQTVGFFLQDMWNINQSLTLVGAVRYDYLSDFDNQFTFRTALTGMSDKGLYGKALIGSAYRVPVYREYLKAGKLNTQIQPENIYTFEGQIGKTFKRADVNLTMYYNMYRDFIGEVSVVKAEGVVFEDDGELDPDEYYINFDKKDIIGLELFSRIYPTQNLRIDVGASIIPKASETIGKEIRSLDEVGEENLETVPDEIVTEFPLEKDEQDITLLSRTTGFIGVNYRFPKIFNVGLSGFGGTRMDTPDGYYSDVIDDVPADAKDDNLSAFFIPNAYVNSTFGNFSLNVAVKNFTNSKVYSPNISSFKEYDIEMEGLSLEAVLSYSF